MSIEQLSEHANSSSTSIEPAIGETGLIRQEVGQPEQEIKQNFGQLLRTFRKREGLTQKELAKKLSIDHSAISHLERGRNLPQKINFYLNIQEALSLDQQELGQLLTSIGLTPPPSVDILRGSLKELNVAGVSELIEHFPALKDIMYELGQPSLPEDHKKFLEKLVNINLDSAFKGYKLFRDHETREAKQVFELVKTLYPTPSDPK